MFALTLALTLGTDPTAAEMAMPPARVIGWRERIWTGMTLTEMERALGRPADFVHPARGMGSTPRHAVFDSPNIIVIFEKGRVSLICPMGGIFPNNP
jgi:hypothetical protein